MTCSDLLKLHVSGCLCLFFIFVYIFLGFVCIAGPQAQTQFLSQHGAVGFLWKGQININNTSNILMN